MKSPFVLWSTRSCRSNTVAELIKYAKESPTPLNYSSAGVGSSQHLSMEFMAQRFGLKMTHVPYRNSPQAIADIAAGHVNIGFAEAGATLPLIRDGKLRVLGVTSSTRLPNLPDVLPFAEASGDAEFEAVSWHILFAPAATPSEIIDRLHQEMRKIMSAPDMKKRVPISDYCRSTRRRSKGSGNTSSPSRRSGAPWSRSSGWKARSRDRTDQSYRVRRYECEVVGAC